MPICKCRASLGCMGRDSFKESHSISTVRPQHYSQEGGADRQEEKERILATGSSENFECTKGINPSFGM